MSLCARYRGRLPAVLVLLIMLAGCAPEGEPVVDGEEETLSRTAFTDRIENFFEYTPLRSGAPSAFLIHLTDLRDGAPVAEAQVDLSVRDSAADREVASTTAQVGRVTGIYVAELVAPSPGTYAIEFRVRNEQLDEAMLLGGFEVEGVR